MRLRFTAFFLLAFCLCVTVVQAEISHLWSQNYGDADDQYMGACFADPFGNTVICGSFYGTINITTPFTSFGRRDVIVAKFAPDGTPMWSDRIGFTSVDTGWSATSDNVGNTIVVGSVGPSANVRNAFIARYSPAGTQQWIKYFVAGDSIAYTEVVDTDATKHIHVAGRFNGNINLGGSTLVAQAENDIFLAEFDAAGNHLWSKSFTNGGNFGEVHGIGVDPNGQPALFGSFSGSADFGGGILTSTSAGDLFLAKFSESGAHLWSKRFGLSNYHEGADLAVDANGRIAITGRAWGDIDFGGGTMSPVVAPDIFLAVLNSSGGHVWSSLYGAGNYEVGQSVAFASNHDVLLSAHGYGTDAFSFGGDPMVGQEFWLDMYIARFFGADGEHRWSYRFYGLDGSTYGYIDEHEGEIILGGTMTADTDFGLSPLSNAGGEDIFVVRYGDHLTGAGPTLARATLLQNSPNPFNPQTRIEYTLASPARAIIEIFDASGAVVSRLDEGRKPAGTYSTMWNARDMNGRAVASGVYFYRLAGMPDVAAKKMVLLK